MLKSWYQRNIRLVYYYRISFLVFKIVFDANGKLFKTLKHCKCGTWLWINIICTGIDNIIKMINKWKSMHSQLKLVFKVYFFSNRTRKLLTIFFEISYLSSCGCIEKYFIFRIFFFSITLLIFRSSPRRCCLLGAYWLLYLFSTWFRHRNLWVIFRWFHAPVAHYLRLRLIGKWPTID